MSKNWLSVFWGRWKSRLSRVKLRARARSPTPEKVAEYYEKLEAVLSLNNLQDKPQHIYILDETGLQPEHRPPNVVANPKTKCQAITSPRSTKTTLIGCVNALVTLLCRRQVGHVRLWVVEQPNLLTIPIGTFPLICQALYQRQTADPAYLRWSSHLPQIAATNNMGKRDWYYLYSQRTCHIFYNHLMLQCSAHSRTTTFQPAQHSWPRTSARSLPAKVFAKLHARHTSEQCHLQIFSCGFERQGFFHTAISMCHFYAATGSVQKLLCRKPGADG